MNWLRLHQGFLREGEGGGEGGSGGGGGEGGGAPPPGGTLLSGAGESGGGSGGTPAVSWVKDDSGALADGWLDRLDGELKGHASLKPIGSIVDLAKSYVETKKLIGTKLEMPGENATPEQWQAWRKVTGAPDAPEGYLGEVKTFKPEGLPDQAWDVEAEKGFLALAHKHGLPPAAVKDIMGFYAKSLEGGFQKGNEEHSQHLAGEMGKLKQAWGKDFDANIGLAARVAKTVGLDTATHPMFTDAAVVQAFAKLGKMFSETALVPGENGSAGGGIASRITEIQDPKSTALVAREYRGEFGPDRQAQAAEVLRGLLKAQSEMK